jgi:hypothetical protein
MAVAGAMVGGQGGGHDRPYAEQAVDRPGTLDDAAKAHERNLRWKDHAIDRFDAVLAETSDGQARVAEIAST